MKSTHTTYGIALSVMLLVIIVLMLLRNEDIKRISGLEEGKTVSDSEIIYLKDALGHTIAQKKAAELRGDEFRDAMPRLADALTKGMDIKLKNLRAGLVADFTARGSGNAGITRIPYDTTHRISSDSEFAYQIKDGKLFRIKGADTLWLSESFEPFAINIDDGYLHAQVDVYTEYQAPYIYNYTDTLTYAFEMKRDKWHQPKRLYGSGKLNNPNAKITNSQSVLINEFKTKRFGVGPSVSWGLGPDLKPQTTIGFSIQWSWFRF